MIFADLIQIAQEALLLVFLLSLPVFAVALLTGVITGFLNNFTRISDSSVGSVARILAVFITIAVMAPFMASRVSDFAVRTWGLIQVMTSGS